MKRLLLLRLALTVCGVGMGMVLAHLSADGAGVTIKNAKCQKNGNCNQCVYRIEGDSNCTSRQRCRAHNCGANQTTTNICIYASSGEKVCDPDTSLNCSDCSYSDCGCVIDNKCDGCECPTAGGTGISTGYTVCVP